MVLDSRVGCYQNRAESRSIVSTRQKTSPSCCLWTRHTPSPLSLGELYESASLGFYENRIIFPVVIILNTMLCRYTPWGDSLLACSETASVGAYKFARLCGAPFCRFHRFPFRHSQDEKSILHPESSKINYFPPTVVHHVGESIVYARVITMGQ